MRTLEIDYYAREERVGAQTVRYHVKTQRLTVTDSTIDADLPFMLAKAVGQHHGIIRTVSVNAPQSSQDRSGASNG